MKRKIALIKIYVSARDDFLGNEVIYFVSLLTIGIS